MSKTIKPFVHAHTSGVTTELSCTCNCCGDVTKLIVDTSNFVTWSQGSLVQDAFPDMDRHNRELLISGTCNNCFSSLFGPSTPFHSEIVLNIHNLVDFQKVLEFLINKHGPNMHMAGYDDGCVYFSDEEDTHTYVVIQNCNEPKKLTI